MPWPTSYSRLASREPPCASTILLRVFVDEGVSCFSWRRLTTLIGSGGNAMATRLLRRSCSFTDWLNWMVSSFHDTVPRWIRVPNWRWSKRFISRVVADGLSLRMPSMVCSILAKRVAVSSNYSNSRMLINSPPLKTVLFL